MITREIRRATGGRTQAKVEQFEKFVRGEEAEDTSATTESTATTAAASTTTTFLS